jgi:hypothetical protein
MVDKDGHFTYSQVKTVKFDVNNANKPRIYPNPTTDRLTIEVTSNQSETILFDLFNTEGQLVYSNKLDSKIGINRHILNTNSSPKGFYILKIKQNNSIVVEKIVIR